jgi:hypothetical protein
VFPPKRLQVQISYKRLQAYKVTRQVSGGGGFPCPTNEGVLYTNLESCMVVTLKIDYYYYIINKKKVFSYNII